jgi:Transposase IS116/IS110/IS902 family
MRQRAALLTHVQQTNRQDHLPEIGTKLASTANRDGVAERFPDPAVQNSIAVDLALIDDDARLLNDLARHIVNTAQAPDANTRYRLPSVPGIGTLVSLVLWSAMHDIRRFPRVQDVAS